MSEKQLTLTYVYDPLCGWCYGFSPVIKKFYKKFRTKLDFEVISGGMILGDRIGPIGQVAAYIKDAYRVVEERSGVEFGKPFLAKLDEGKMIISSLPPSRALTAFKIFRHHDAILMAHEIQKSIYYQGNAPGDEQAYLKLAAKFELDVDAYQEALWSDQIAQKTEEEFKRSSQLSVQGFPTVLLSNGQEVMAVSRGFLPYEEFMMNMMNAAAYFEVELV